MKRIAWFTPLPSSPPGLPCHRAALIARLQEHYAIDLFVQPSPKVGHAGAALAMGPHDFVWRHVRKRYDLTVYDLADSSSYDFVWAYLVRYPGLVVLHDEHLHRSRLRMLQAQGRDDAYRAEFRYNHPQASPDVPELGLAGLLGASSGFWPMRRVVLESSRWLLVRSGWVAETLRTESHHDRIGLVEPGAPRAESSPETRDAVRTRYGIGAGSVVFAIFGPLTRARRVSQVLASLARLKSETPPLHLLLCGEPDGVYDCQVDIDRLGVADRVTHVRIRDPSELLAHLAASDVCVCLQWPPGRDAITTWIEALAAGKSTIVTDLAERVDDIPSLDPRDWQQRTTAPADGHAGGPHQAACVSVNILDEDHSLRLAMWRLASDQALRARLGREGLKLWERRFRFDRLEMEFGAAIEHALDVPQAAIQRPDLPHLRAAGTEHVKTLLEPFGVQPDGFEGLAPSGAPEVPSEP